MCQNCSKELAKTYDPKGIEGRLYKKWEDNGYFHAEVDRSKKPFTIVMPPPNITGQLHMGHALDNTMQDILIRYKRMQGYAGAVRYVSTAPQRIGARIFTTLRVPADTTSQCWMLNQSSMQTAITETAVIPI